MGKSIRFQDYHVSSKTGFLLENPKEYLPEYYEPWNRLAKAMPGLVAKHQMRAAITELPLLDHGQLSGHREQRLAYLQLGIMAAGYVWEEGDSGAAKRLPRCVAIPLWEVSAVLGVKPIISHPAVCLANWTYTDDLGNIRCLYVIPGGDGCEWFFKVTCFVEFAFAKGLQSLQNILDGVSVNDGVKVTTSLVELAAVIGNMLQELKRMHENLSADKFYNVLRPYLSGWGGESNPLPNGLLYEGVSDEPVKIMGGSAAQSTTLQLLDSILGVDHKPDKQKFLTEMRNYMPMAHRHLLQDVDQIPRTLKHMVIECQDDELKQAHNTCLEALTGFRTYHIQLVTKYVVIAAKRQAQVNNYKSLATKGTGGTDLLPFLKQLRDDTKEQIAGTKVHQEDDMIHETLPR